MQVTTLPVHTAGSCSYTVVVIPLSALSLDSFSSGPSGTCISSVSDSNLDLLNANHGLYPSSESLPPLNVLSGALNTNLSVAQQIGCLRTVRFCARIKRGTAVR